MPKPVELGTCTRESHRRIALVESDWQDYFLVILHREMVFMPCMETLQV